MNQSFRRSLPHQSLPRWKSSASLIGGFAAGRSRSASATRRRSQSSLGLVEVDLGALDVFEHGELRCCETTRIALDLLDPPQHLGVVDRVETASRDEHTALEGAGELVVGAHCRLDGSAELGHVVRELAEALVELAAEVDQLLRVVGE